MYILDATEELLKNGPMTFKELWEALHEIDEFKSYKNKGGLYDSMVSDPRFTAQSGNYWDLARKYKYEDIHKQVEMPDDDFSTEENDNDFDVNNEAIEQLNQDETDGEMMYSMEQDGEQAEFAEEENEEILESELEDDEIEDNNEW